MKTEKITRTRRCRVDTGCKHATDNSATSPCHQCQYSGEGFSDKFERNVPVAMTDEQRRLFRAMHGISEK